MPELSLQIVEFAREHGRVTIGEAMRLTGASRNTLERQLRALVERRSLNQHGSGRGVRPALKADRKSRQTSPAREAPRLRPMSALGPMRSWWPTMGLSHRTPL